jgi:hypothetical protein
VRKLNQAKKKISASDTPDLQSALHELRLDLNYILVGRNFHCIGAIRSNFTLRQHYPKTKKYISLFPPELRAGETQEPTADAGREEVRTWIRSQMESGELSAEPELHLDSRGSGGTADWGGEKKKKKSKSDGTAKPEVEADPEDDFFEDDDEVEGSDDS